MNFSIQKIIMVITYSTLAVLGHWGIWSEGVYALGFNTTLFWLFLGFMLWGINPQLRFKKDYCWITPLFLMALSFSLYENPWLKTISCFLLPICTALFYAYSQLINARNHFWGFSLLLSIFKRTFLPLKHIVGIFGYFKLTVSNSVKQKNHNLSKRIFTGVLLLIPIAVIILVLLSSADSNFNHLIDRIFSKVFILFDFTTLAKMFCILGLAIVLFASLHAFKTPYEITEHKSKIPLDDIVIGIVMSGILVIYLIFLWLQIEYILLDTLPKDFKATEKIVKSGFWQLFFLSILNTALFLMIYKKTGTTIEYILRIFIAASGLLLLSAAWRMSLYVYWYGFSYEKFFASYTTVFSLFIFIYLLMASFAKQRKDVFKVMAFAALWTYAIATVMPIEKIIFNSNVQLNQLSSSRINLYELETLSIDVISDVRKMFDETNTIKNKTSYFHMTDWNNWANKLEQKHCDRTWYESNMSLVMLCHK